MLRDFIERGYLVKMKKLILLLLMSIFLSTMTPASADQVTLNGFSTFTYPGAVKLKKSGCQEIPIGYVTDEKLPREDTAFLIVITPKSNKKAYGLVAWFSTLTYMGENAMPANSRIGTLKIKVCRKPWLYSSKATKLTPAITPGTYRIFFDGSFVDPITGGLVGEKIEIIRTIKFT